MPEKKCFNCENMNFCGMYDKLNDMAGLLNINLETHIIAKVSGHIATEMGFITMVNHMAHDCKRFSAFKEGV